MGSQCCSSKPSNHTKTHKYYQNFSQKYKIGKIIGLGSNSIVKLAENYQNKQKYAIKIFDKTQTIKNNTYKNVLHQKKIFQTIQSQTKQQFNKLNCIVKLKQCMQDKQKLYLILQYMPFGNLRQLIKYKKKQQFSQQKIRFICICMLIALRRMDQCQVIHGDIKPENIMIDEEGCFKLTDFSSARFYSCQSNEILGSKGYTTPQIINSSQNPITLQNNKSDMYSLGIILWQLLNGIPYNKFLGNQQKSNKSSSSGNMTQNSQSAQTQQQVEISLVSEQCQNFINSLLKQNPLERMSVNQAWKHDWIRIYCNQTNIAINHYQQLNTEILHNKLLQANPFLPVQEYFNYTRVKSNIIPINCLASRRQQQNSDLFSSVLLNQKKIQDIFLSFNSNTCKLNKYKKGSLLYSSSQSNVDCSSRLKGKMRKCC